MAEMKTYSGWFVRAMLLRKIPEQVADFVVEIKGGQSDLKPYGLFPTKNEAVQQATQDFTKQRSQALKDLEFLSRPYTSPNGFTYCCPESKLEEWRGEAQKCLETAERGLELCAASKP